MAIFAVMDIDQLFVDDVPVSPTRCDFIDENGDAVQISTYTHWNAYMLAPDNSVAGELTGTITGQHLEFPWPDESILTMPGVFRIVIQLRNGGPTDLTVEPFSFVVQEISNWLSLEHARAQWPDAPLDDVLLYQILESAKTQILAYAPALAAGAVIPANYVQAQLMQARALYQSVIANQNDTVGVDGFAVRVFPLDFTIRALLRPKRAIGGMF